MRRGVNTVLAAALLAGGLGLATAAPASAATVPGDDRLQAKPVGWWSYSNLTINDVTAKLQEHGARMTDLRVDNGTFGQWRFTVTMVANGGSYGVGWWWYFNKSAAEVNTLLSQNSARPISLQRYWDGSAWRNAVVMVSNTGANQRDWTLAEGAASTIENATRTLAGYRLAGVSAYACNIYPGCTPERRFVTIFEDNPEGYAAKFHHSKSAAALGGATAGAQMVDLDPNDDGTFNAITYAKPWATWQWWFDQSHDGLVERARQHGLRLIDVTAYRKNGGVYYAGIMVDNLTGLSAQLRNMYEGTIPEGARYGFRLRQWNGPTLAALQDDVVFEPASAIKVLIHLHAIKNEQNGLSPSTPIAYRWTYKPYPDMNDAGICPIGAPWEAQLDLDTADKAMMQHSDNRMTQGIYDFFQTHMYQDNNGHWTSSQVAQTATALNLTGTNLQLFTCDRANYPNATTLRDLAAIYQAGYLRTDILDAPHRESFKMNMATSGWAGLLKTMIAEERAKLGIKTTTFDKLVSDNSMGKGGALGWSNTYWRANAGLVAIPTDSLGTSFTYYEFGCFMSNAKASAQFPISQIDAIHNGVWIEALRGIVHDALVNWQ